MRIIILPNAKKVAQYAADRLAQQISIKANSVLGLATGSTPLALYKELISRYQNAELSFKQVKSFNLDEYIGISAEHNQSYRYFMNHHLFEQLDIQPDNTQVPAANLTTKSELVKSAADYEAQIAAAGGIDLQILGIGINGHIGFNEPSSSLASRTRVKTLSQSTVEANKRFFDEGEFQPYLALTMGIGTILEAKDILLLATGENKANAIKAMVEGPLSAMVPASALQQHTNVTVIIDEAAAAELSLKEYYQWSEKQQDLLAKSALTKDRLAQSELGKTHE
ncbi:glucosamine-6-phosphate deaminase [Marinomonas sp. PE14-40]|uniref:glucosamine-6-phosphate deaminase n=1 Tax=Marinomonas sp. PE14-40 TaxID=3060621 RepID=UPI003F676B4B